MNLLHSWIPSIQCSSSCRAPGSDGFWAATWSSKKIHSCPRSIWRLPQFPCHALSSDVVEGLSVKRTALDTWSRNIPLLPYCQWPISRQFLGHPCSCLHPFIDLSDIWSCSCTMYILTLVIFLCDNNIHTLCGLYNYSHCFIIVFIVNLTIFVVGYVPVSISRAHGCVGRE